MFANIAVGAHAYFVHSYAMRARDPAHVLATSDYGGAFTAAVGRDNIAGTQFHPEKSQAVGLDPARQFPGVAAVILFPAIDLKDGRCVRLKRGAMDPATVFNDDPAAQALTFEQRGLSMAALCRSRRRLRRQVGECDAIRAIRAATNLPIQLGGGIRDMAAIEGWLAAGHHAGDPGHRRR